MGKEKRRIRHNRKLIVAFLIYLLAIGMITYSLIFIKLFFIGWAVFLCFEILILK